MYLKNAIIKNTGPIKKLEINFPFNTNDMPKPLLLVGKNGTGKSIFISHIVDALYEFAKLNFTDVLKITPESQSPYFKINGHINLKNDCKYGYQILNFFDINNKDENFYYFEKEGKISKQDIEREIGVALHPDIRFSEDNNCKQISNKRKELEEIFLNNIFCYFPPNRFENPHWLLTENIKNSDINEKNYKGYLNRDIMIANSMPQNKKWIFDVFLDSRADLERNQDEKNNTTFKVSREYIYEFKTSLNNIQKILSEILEKPDVQLSLNHRNSGYTRLSIKNKKGEIIIPSLEHLSTGQSVLLNLFTTIMHYADKANLINSIKLSEIKGIVVIDEIEMHLHAELQKNILPKLIKLFPKVQFIITTHSPLFLLGMEEIFGKDGIEIRELPEGQIISSERFSEFKNAFEYFEKTETFEKEINKKIEKTIEKEQFNKILIIEDEQCINVWENFLNKYGITDIKVCSSNGCDNNQWETYAINAQKIEPQKKITIYRLIDRDGRQQEDITSLKQNYNDKYKNYNFTLECLPFYEIENILLFDGIFERLFPSIKDKITEINRLYEVDEDLQTAFRITLRDKLLKQYKEKHNNSSEIEKNICKSEKIMCQDKIHLLNGKEILKKLRNNYKAQFNDEKELENISLECFPQELRQILDNIKKHFMSNCKIST